MTAVFRAHDGELLIFRVFKQAFTKVASVSYVCLVSMKKGAYAVFCSYRGLVLEVLTLIAHVHIMLYE